MSVQSPRTHVHVKIMFKNLTREGWVIEAGPRAALVEPPSAHLAALRTAYPDLITQINTLDRTLDLAKEVYLLNALARPSSVTSLPER